VQKLSLNMPMGTIIKGYTFNFFPHKDRFHVMPIDKPSDKPIEVLVNQLKRFSWFKISMRNHKYVERKGTSKEKPLWDTIEVTFGDGEVMVGSCMGIDLKRQRFFISPQIPSLTP